MMLFLFSIFIIISGILISLCWKITKGVVGLTSKIVLPSTPPIEHDYFADDTNAIWLKGIDNRHFRFDLKIDSIDSPAKYEQIDKMNEFLNAYGIPEKGKELVNV